MRIALTMRVTQATGYIEPRDSISHDWICRLEQWGMIALLIPNTLKDPEAYCADLKPDVLILTGGDNPGETEVRDRTEYRLLDYSQ
ncbi:MAG: hypothetical protein L3J74_18530, partial [Bacteroidales bacterium]|nr:hypothetical protein [Bacteroidales bacterium]